ncbi:hypothetical protein [Variovorax paradoxus]|uniref:hypothetical protein n=1 Tax=Variovorax paradoxus TaxID=34073 RepID=UPI00339304D4
MTSFPKLLIAMLMLLGIATDGSAQAQVKMGTYLPSAGTPQLAVVPLEDGGWGPSTDVCRKCLAGGPKTPTICPMLRCAAPDRELMVKVLVPPIAAQTITESCGINRLCMKDNFEVLKNWPPKPGDPNPYEKPFRPDQLTKPYKGFLELSRLDADRQLKVGAISRSDYDQILKNYRSDWKSLQLGVRP